MPVVPEAISNEVIRLREWGTDWIHMLLPQPSVSDRFGDASPDWVVGTETTEDPEATEWRITDDVIRLREWGTDIIHRLPHAPWDSAVIGTAETCALQVVDRSGWASPEHARVDRGLSGWLVRDIGSKNGIRADGAHRAEVQLKPGIELGVGSLTLIAESRRFIELRSFIARLLGWTADKTAMVDFALRAIRVAATRRAPLVLCGPGDLISVAHAIHRHALGRAKPFVVSDPRRRDGDESVRSAENSETGLAAMRRARGGSLCMWSRWSLFRRWSVCFSSGCQPRPTPR